MTRGVSEITICGAGPIGLELAVALKRLGRSYDHFEAGSVGETIRRYPKRAVFFSSPERIAIAGLPLVTGAERKATREEYLNYLRQVVLAHDLKIRTGERLLGIEPSSRGFELSTSYRGEHMRRSTQNIVLATGDMHRPRRLGIEGEDLPHVEHAFDEPYPYLGRRVLIVGGKNSAVEAALRISRAGGHVSLSYRRAAFTNSVKVWIRPDIENLIRRGVIDFYPETVPTEITASEVRLGSVTGGPDTRVAVDSVLILIGFEQEKSLFESAGVLLEGENRAPRLSPQCETNVPGLYVAGTAVAGTQVNFQLFIENSHPHVDRICRALTGQRAPFPTHDATELAEDAPES